MSPTAEQLAKTGKANVKALEGMTSHAIDGFHRLVELNLAAAKATVFESLSQAQAMLGAKDPQQLLALQTSLFQPMLMKYVSYRSQAYTIAAETGADIVKSCGAVIDSVEKSMPATEPMAVMFMNAVSASQMAIETAQGTAKKALEMVEANLEAANHHGDPGTTTASRKR
ncbi:phasin family protein [Polaromonas sp.]|uniref:phasin family protein n=1 Tax=Polaromonas sp. TaxID=1869339 RepID=UPI00286B4D92|nr:phasin family protein [Polaromonas sp.]